MLTCTWLGMKNMPDVLALQHALFIKKLQGDRNNTVLMCEHPSVYTYDARVKNQRLWRTSKGTPPSNIPIVVVERAGGITYHGPGQLVVYCVLDLRDFQIAGLLHWNHVIHEIVIAVLNFYGVRGRTRTKPHGAQGIWVVGRDHHMRKIASRGVTLRESITRFGFALNVSPDLSRFDPIYPCGLDIEMTSIWQETGSAVLVKEVAQKIAQTIAETLAKIGK